MPYFSVIVPTHNSGRTLSDTLKSVMCQTFCDFEVLLMDGLSSDCTLEVAESLNDSRIRIYSKADNGVYQAMNAGIRLAKGEWIYFLGSDDRMYSYLVLEELYQIVRCGGYDVVYGDVVSTRFHGRYDGHFSASKILVANICHQAIFFHRNLFCKIGLFNERYKVLADWDHNMRWILSGNVVSHYVDIVVAEYSDGGLSSTHPDPALDKDRVINYLLYAKHLIPFRLRIYYLSREAWLKMRRFDVSSFLRVLAYTPRILCGL